MRKKIDKDINVSKLQKEIEKAFPGSGNFQWGEGAVVSLKFSTSAKGDEIDRLIASHSPEVDKPIVPEVVKPKEPKEVKLVVETKPKPKEEESGEKMPDYKKIVSYEESKLKEFKETIIDPEIKVAVDKAEKAFKDANAAIVTAASASDQLAEKVDKKELALKADTSALEKLSEEIKNVEETLKTEMKVLEKVFEKFIDVVEGYKKDKAVS